MNTLYNLARGCIYTAIFSTPFSNCASSSAFANPSTLIATSDLESDLTSDGSSTDSVSQPASRCRYRLEAESIEQADCRNTYIMHAPLAGLLRQYRTDLPSAHDAKHMVQEITKRFVWGEECKAMLHRLKYPELFSTERASAHILFTGDSDYDNKTLIKAVAAYTKIPCIFIPGDEIRCGNQESAVTFLINFVERLRQHKEQQFLILIDDISMLTEQCHVYGLWDRLASYHAGDNVTLIAVDDRDPKDLDMPVQHYFSPHIFSCSQRYLSETTGNPTRTEAEQSTTSAQSSGTFSIKGLVSYSLFFIVALIGAAFVSN